MCRSTEIGHFASLDLFLHGTLPRAETLLLFGYSPREPDDCPRLDRTTRAIIDTPGFGDLPFEAIEIGGANDCSSFIDCTSSCRHPAFMLPTAVLPPEQSESAAIHVIDPGGVWTMTAVKPFAVWPTSFAHEVTEYAASFVYDDGRLGFDLSRARSEVETTTSEIRFQVPAIEPGRGRRTVSGSVGAIISSCDGPLTCSIAVARSSDSMTIMAR